MGCYGAGEIQISIKDCTVDYAVVSIIQVDVENRGETIDYIFRAAESLERPIGIFVYTGIRS